MTFNSNAHSAEDALTQETSTLAQHCLDYLVSDPEELVRFMGNSGYDPDALRAAIDTLELNMALLNYFATNEAAMLAMCANANINPTRFMRCWNQHNAHI